MAQKKLDYGSHEGSELFNTETPYLDSEKRWAARGDWFIRFWGYVFKKITKAETVTVPTGMVMAFVDSDTGKLTTRDENDAYIAYPTLPNVKQINWFMS